MFVNLRNRLRWECCLLLIASLFLPVLARADTSYYERYSDNPLVYLEGTAYFFTAEWLTAFLHESSHGLLAKTFGATDVSSSIYLVGGRTTFTIVPQMSKFDLGLVYSAGYVTQRALAYGTNLVLNTTDATGALSRWGGTFYLVNHLGISADWALGFVTRNSDSYQISKVIAGNGIGADFVNIGIGAVLALDIYLSWDVIKKNWRRFLGYNVSLPDQNHAFILTPNYVGFVSQF